MSKQRCPEKYLKKFPAYYCSLPCTCPKASAIYDYDEFEAYRACIGLQVEPIDFRSYFELGDANDPENASSYSVSLFTDIIKPKQMLKSKRYKSVAKGIIKKLNGPIKKSDISTHVDWWLYENADPVIDFEVIDI